MSVFLLYRSEEWMLTYVSLCNCLFRKKILGSTNLITVVGIQFLLYLH